MAIPQDPPTRRRPKSTRCCPSQVRTMWKDIALAGTSTTIVPARTCSRRQMWKATRPGSVLTRRTTRNVLRPRHILVQGSPS